jgi:tetratricopeptide (TPR) repeat protein
MNILRYISIRKDNSGSEASITSNLAVIYSEAGIPDKAEEYYRKALSLEPNNPGRMANLSYFLIDKDRNIIEGLELVDKAIALRPEYYPYLGCKGWGLYKQGRYKEALEFLEKNRDSNLFYQQILYNQIAEVKKALAGQKNI